MTIILGTFGSSSTPFGLYTYNSYRYFCLDEVNTVYCKNNLTRKALEIHRIFKAAPNDFIKNKTTGHIFVMTRTMLQIARMFNCYALAELCKLSIDEILGRVAEPLLNNIQCDQWQHALNYHVLVERDLQFESLYGDEWIFTATPSTAPLPKTHIIESSHSSSSSCHPMPDHKSQLYRWLSLTLNDLSSHKAKKQQQAIIETRQRQQAFMKPTNKSKKKIAGQLNPLPPHTNPPPPLSNTNNHHNKRKSFSSYSQQQHTTAAAASNKRQRALQQQPPLAVTASLYHHHLHHHHHQTEGIIDHGNDNLNLLATQAMQLRGLPPSPSPEPAFKNQRLPSIQTMLSELNQHRVVHFGERRNMDSCA
ncbi:hypothetical protein [Parasitella parasitica]|uniref:Uncharacterized protein n=1 Tax=Parasitella parasitica TaxID=35722 RepID=A0A0B7NAA0_9FUNG|nr:hypothetical protein [Parasitella parasitica]